MNKRELVISNGNTFLISDISGDIGTENYHGLFSADVRHLSKAALLLDSVPTEVLSSQQTGFDSATMVLTNTASRRLARFDLSIIRKRTITKVFYEDMELINNSDKQKDFIFSLAFDTDFADIFEIKSLTNKENKVSTGKRFIQTMFRKKENQLVFSYARDEFRRTTVIHFSQAVKAKGNTVYLTLSLKPKQHLTFSFSIAFLIGRKTITVTRISRIREKAKVLREWHWMKLKLATDWDDLERVFAQSVSDLAALRIYQEEIPGKITSLPAAGIPWFVAVFGRDSLITAYQTLIFGPDFSINILKFLAKFQGKEINSDRDEQPGKILHEMRFGEAACFRNWVPFPYYGTVDATPLFLILLSEVYRFGASRRFINQMKKPALAALDWIDKYGDQDLDGFIEYQKRSEKGLYNQNWRDSFDSMMFSSGKVAESPIASSDVQGYVYDAKMRIAEIAGHIWQDARLAAKLEQEAKILKKSFNKAFWVEDKGYFALGLDKDKKQIDSLSSSNGHLLWSGIVEEDKIAGVVKHLSSKQLYSGWGVRTMSTKDKGYNPIIYHRGTVWPFDNSLIATGLLKAGRRELALRIIADTITASSYFDYRLPEVFAGFGRTEVTFPVQYPTAASPQAWSAATPVLFLRLLLGIEPDVKRKTLHINPALPKNVNYINIDGISAFGKYFSITTENGQSIVAIKGY